MNFSQIAASYQIPESSAQMALQMTLEDACKKFFRTPNCWVDVEEQIATIHFRLPKDRKSYNDLARSLGWPEWKPNSYFSFAHEIIPVYLGFDSFPRRILNISKSNLMHYVHLNIDLDVFEKWRKKIQTVVEGVIVEKRSNDSFSVEVGGETCLFPKRLWMKTETREYYPGNTMLFCVHNLILNGSVGILLSRRSLNFPAMLMKFYDPEHTYRCIKRLPGLKSWIETDANPADPRTIRMRAEVSAQLAGELINMRPLEWGMDKSKPKKAKASVLN